MGWAPNTNMAGAVPPAVVDPAVAALRRQEASTNGYRVAKLAAGVGLVILFVLKASGVGGSAAVAAPVPTVIVVTAVPVLVVPTSTATPVPVSFVMCRASAPIGKIVKDGLYKVTSWSRAHGGMVLVEGEGWVSRVWFPCPLGSLPEGIFFDPAPTPTPVATLMPTATRTVVPTATPRPRSTSTPVPVLPGIMLSCDNSGYVRNGLAVAVRVQSVNSSWGMVVDPGRSFWLNPVGDRSFSVTAVGRESGVVAVDQLFCWGGVLR